MTRAKKSRKKLDRAAATLSADRVKMELKELIKENAECAGRQHLTEECTHSVGAEDGSQPLSNDCAKKDRLGRVGAAKVAGCCPTGSTFEGQGRRNGGGERENTEAGLNMVDEAVKNRQLAENAEGVAESSFGPTNSKVAAMQQSSIFPLLTVPHHNAGPNAAIEVSTENDSWRREESLEKRFAVTPGSTVFGSDLDRLERDMLREHNQRGALLPPTDWAYGSFGGGRQGKRMQWEPSSSFDRMPGGERDAGRSNEKVLGDEQNRNLSAYHMSAEACRERYSFAATTERGKCTSERKGMSFVKRGGAGGVFEERAADEDYSNEDLPASSNPHFPASDGAVLEDVGEDSTAVHGSAEAGLLLRSTFDGRLVVVDARTDYRAGFVTVHGEKDDFPYDAYNQRPAEDETLGLRGADFWSDHYRRKEVEKHAKHREDCFEIEKLTEGALDTSEVEYSTNRVRREMLLYFQHYPINEMIQESFVRIREIVPKGGGDKIVMNRLEPRDSNTAENLVEREAILKLNSDVDIPLQEARQMAQSLGLDLVRVGSINTLKSDRRVIALCQIGDHREHLRDMIRFKLQKLGVQPPPTRECIEVPFRGGTHPHAIRFKAVGIAKHLLHRHAVRINLTKFGTPREGFPVFQSILDEVKRQCLQLRAYHRAGEILTNYNEIYCYLYPSTGRSPKVTVDHPTPQMVREARDFHVLKNEKEIFFDDLHDKVTQKERLAYMTKLDEGTAWADKDEGMSLQRQRAIKVMLGYLPKGNRELYAARGDVNVPAPFRTSHMTSTERWGSPAESNLEQASRGAATIGKRAAMPISEMHDRKETPDNPTQLDRFYYRVQGSALELGEFKEALGLKDNRKRRPPLGSGYGTLGISATTYSEQGAAAK